MPIRIKDTASLAKKFAQRAQQAAPDYADGVRAAGADWEANTKAGAQNYAAGVQDAISDGRFLKGVSDAGSSKYVTRASTLGSQRFGPGVAAAQDDWARGVQPHLDALKSMDLPPRGVTGSPQNQQRAQVVAARMRAIRLGK